MFSQGFSVTVPFSEVLYFYHKKLFYNVVHSSSEVLSFPHTWQYCWKCEFDKMSEWNKKVLSPWRRTTTCQNTQSEQEEWCFSNLCIAKNEEFLFIWQKPYWRQRRNWTGKFKWHYFSLIFPEKYFARTSSKPLQKK